MNINLTQKILKKFIKLAAEQLTGDWLLLGGTVLPLVGAQHRSTVDIDFVGLGKNERSQQLELMHIAEELGLPVEVINSAAAIFVDRELQDKNSLVLLEVGDGARIYRPDTLLYFKLKTARMSESDMLDCTEWLKHFKNEITPVVISQLQELISIRLSNTDINSEVSGRLKILSSVINSL